MIVVVIKPDCTGAPPRRAHSGFGGHIRERAISIVVVQDALGILSQVDIRQPVVVVVTHRHTHSVRVSRHAGFFGDIGKRPISVVVVQSVSNGCAGV